MPTQTLFGDRDAAIPPPILPAPGGDADPEALRALRRFHLGRPGTATEPLPAGLMPALFHGLRREPTATGGEKPPLALVAEAAAAHREPAREAFRAEAKELAAAVEAVLAADRAKRPESRGAEALGGAMGDFGARFVDAGALAGVVSARPGAGGMAAERRERLEAALAVLAGVGQKTRADGAVGFGRPARVAVHDGALWATAEPPGWELEAAEDPCAAAAARFDAEAEELARVLRAARLARLEAAGDYDPARHDPWLASFDWQAFSRDELLLLPTIVAVVSADQIARHGLLSLSRLLLSGRPVQVLVTVDPAASPGGDAADAAADTAGTPEPDADPLAGFRFEAGYLGIGHREALVTQTALARPEHLAAGFARAAGAGRTALHVVAVGDDALRAEAALAGRAHALFHYDPEAGASWARRLDFAGNPAPAEDWPRQRLAVTTADGNDGALDLAFTFADYALGEPAFAGSFQRAPGGVPEGEFAPLADVLELAPDAAAAKLPFVWGVDGNGRLQRLVVTRRLALACRDRLATWRTLQELAGVRSEYVAEAEARVRAEVEATAAAERERLVAAHAEELAGLERRSVEQVVDRLTAALLEVDVAAFAGFDSAAAGPLAGLGSTADEVTANLLDLLQSAPAPALAPATTAGEGNGARPTDPRIDQLAAELLVAATSEEPLP